jgi:hypothetical protein
MHGRAAGAEHCTERAFIQILARQEVQCKDLLLDLIIDLRRQ